MGQPKRNRVFKGEVEMESSVHPTNFAFPLFDMLFKNLFDKYATSNI